MQPEQMATMTIHNEILRGNPSSERLMHLTVYQHCPLAKAVVHAHPPTAIAWSIAHPEWTELPNQAMSELILALGNVPIAPYARPGTQAMGDVLIPLLKKSRVIILARHGAIAWGESLEEATNGMERLEHSAEILWKAETLGGITKLSDEEIAVLKSMREKLGEKSL
jgi:L-fuculose-phosphate aldolase